ncbi:unnamed protein product, partial [Rotaria sp. Silwood2]
NCTHDLPKAVKITLERFVKQMKEAAGQVCDGQPQLSTANLSSSSSNAFAEPSKRKKINVGRKVSDAFQISIHDILSSNALCLFRISIAPDPLERMNPFPAAFMTFGHQFSSKI